MVSACDDASDSQIPCRQRLHFSMGWQKGSTEHRSRSIRPQSRHLACHYPSRNPFRTGWLSVSLGWGQPNKERQRNCVRSTECCRTRNSVAHDRTHNCLRPCLSRIGLLPGLASRITSRAISAVSAGVAPISTMSPSEESGRPKRKGGVCTQNTMSDKIQQRRCSNRWPIATARFDVICEAGLPGKETMTALYGIAQCSPSLMP